MIENIRRHGILHFDDTDHHWGKEMISGRIAYLKQETRRSLGFVKRRFQPPQWPTNADGKLLLHIGCGEINSPEFVNVDAQPYPHVHVIKNDVTNLPMFESGSVDLVYMCHILEHLTATELSATLTEMKRILKPNGVLRVSVPDFDRIIDIYQDAGRQVQAIRSPLLGSHLNAYDVHHLVFNQEWLSTQLKQAGFSLVREWDPERCEYHEFEDWASKKIVYGGKEYPISLNLEAVK